MDYYKLKVLNNKRKIIIFIIILLLIGGLLFYYFAYYQDKDELVVKEENSMPMEKEDEKNQEKVLLVDIKGYVEKPGVYSFGISDNARVNDLILKAGGLKKDADTSLINLSKKLEDEMTIIIYSKKEVNDYLNGKNELKEKLSICEEKLKNNACLKNEVKKDNNKININTASKSELMNLTGIGESKANAIIEYRKKNAFTKIEEIKNVEGIGDSLFENIKESITV